MHNRCSHHHDAGESGQKLVDGHADKVHIHADDGRPVFTDAPDTFDAEPPLVFGGAGSPHRFRLNVLGR
jgi:hypothetical protein